MINKIVRLSSVILPGAYRFCAIFLIGYFCTVSVASEYSEMYFWVGLFSTLSGVAVGAMAYSTNSKLSTPHKVIITQLLLITSGLIAYSFWSGSTNDYYIIIGAASFLGLFEVFRSDLATDGEFLRLCLSGGASMILLIATVLLFGSSSSWLLLSSFFALLLPILLFNNYKSHSTAASLPFVVGLKTASRYSLSNGLSMGISSIVPLLLIKESDSNTAIIIAQVFAIASICLFYPRYLSADFIVTAKKSNANKALLNQFFYRILLFIAIISLAYYFISSLYFKEYTSLGLLFIGIQLSQLSLPYSNLLMVLGHSKTILFINIAATSGFASIILFSYLFNDNRAVDKQIILISFAGLMIARYLLSKYFSRNLLP